VPKLFLRFSKGFREVASAAKTDRAQLRRLLGQLDGGDVLLTIHPRPVEHARGDPREERRFPLARRRMGPTPTTAHRRLMLTVLGGLAEFERDLIHARTADGRARAKKRGVRLGRRPKLTPHQQQEAQQRKQSGEAIRDIARSYNVHNSTISRLTADR